MSKSNLRNTEAIKDLLKNEHKSQKRRSVPLKDQKSVEIEERKKKQERLKELRKKYNTLKCPVCGNLLSRPQDKKFVRMTGKCMSCKIEEDTSMKLEGTFEEYQFNFMYNNLLAFLNNAEKDIDVLKRALSDAEYVNDDGSVEKWELPYSKEEMEQKIEDDFESFKNDLLERYKEYLNKIKNK